MKLLEKQLLTDEEYTNLNQLSGSERKNELTRLAEKYFGENPDYEAMKGSLVDSFLEYGTNTSQNKFLLFANTKGDTALKCTADQMWLIYTLIQNSETNVVTGKVAQTSWLYDPRSYNGSDFKIKALAFLASDEAEDYGDIRRKPTKEILATTDDNEIEKLLSNWQTKDGESSSKNYHSKRRSKIKNAAKQNLFKNDTTEVAELKTSALANLETTFDLTEAQLIALLNKVYTANMTEEELYTAVIKEIGSNVLANR